MDLERLKRLCFFVPESLEHATICYPKCLTKRLYFDYNQYIVFLHCVRVILLHDNLYLFLLISRCNWFVNLIPFVNDDYVSPGRQKSSVHIKVQHCCSLIFQNSCFFYSMKSIIHFFVLYLRVFKLRLTGYYNLKIKNITA